MKNIVIVGGGFGGLTAAKEFINTEYRVTILDKTNYHLFQPLLYQVATAALSPGDIAVPIRAVFKDAENINVLMEEVVSVNTEKRVVISKENEFPYDFLILAPGSRHSYFGKDEWEKFAPGLKDLDDALKIRERILSSFEQAEKSNSPQEREAHMSFVVIGGGPTGVEMAGAIAEMAKKDLVRDFRNINSAEAKIYLIEGTSQILSSYSGKLSETAKNDLEEMGVIVLNGELVTEITEHSVTLGEKSINSKNIIWAAGNQASPLLKTLDTVLDKAGRVVVEDDLSVPGHPEVFVIGDSARVEDAKHGLLPGVATVAIQQGKYTAKLIKKNYPPEERPAFKYLNKGNMATIGRAKAIAVVAGLEFSGIVAWLLWSFIHIMYLIGFKNRVKVMAEWIWFYVTSRHGIRLITRKS